MAKRTAQFMAGDIRANASGTGSDHSRPTTLKTITGTQIQWISLFVGFRWLSPYSSSQLWTERRAMILHLAGAAGGQ